MGAQLGERHATDVESLQHDGATLLNGAGGTSRRAGPGAYGDAMASLRAQLSTIASSLDDLTLRVAALADEQYAIKAEQNAVELEEAERSLRSGVRRLERLLRTLPS